MRKDNIFFDIIKTAENYPDKKAVVCSDDSISYENLVRQAQNIASVLSQNKLNVFDTCLLISDDSIEYIIVALGIVAANAVFVSAGKEITNNKFIEILRDINVNFILLEEKYLDNLFPIGFQKEYVLNLKSKKFAIFRKISNDIFNSENYPNIDDFKSVDPAFIRFSSGTTSKRKGVVLSHSTIKNRTDSANTVLKISQEDRVLWLLPMAYHFAVTIMLFLRRGATIDVASHLSYEKVLKKLLSGDITFTYATPFHYSELVKADSNSGNGKIRIPKSVRMMISTAMPLSKKISDQFFQKFNRYLNQAYGIIECGLPCINHKPNAENVLSVGYPLPDSMISIALHDEKLSKGEIVIKSRGMFDAYYFPWILSEKITSHKMFFSGDIGQFENSCLNIIGRKKSVINFLGHKIFPEQIEEIIKTHPAVQDVIVLPEQHEHYGEIPVAHYLIRNNASVSPNELLAFCSSKLSSREIPQEFVKVDSIPRTANGKLKRC